MYPEEFEHRSPRDRSRRVIQQLKPEVIAMAEAIRESGYFEGRSRAYEEMNARQAEQIDSLKEKLESAEYNRDRYKSDLEGWRDRAVKAEEKLKKPKVVKRARRTSKSD